MSSLLNARSVNLKIGPAAGIWLRPDLAAMGLDDRARNGKAHAHSLWLGGDEWLKQLRRDVSD